MQIKSIFKPFRLIWGKTWFRQLFWVGLTFVLVHAMIITVYGLNDDQESADVAIVLGNRVFSDGTLATWTAGRVDVAYDLYQKKKVKYIFVSGGVGKDDLYPEGTGMKKYLLKKGVPDSAIIVDDQGINSFQTAVNFLRWKKDHQCTSVYIVSQFYHAARCELVFKKLGIADTIYHASSKQYSVRDIDGAFREVPAFYKYLIWY